MDQSKYLRGSNYQPSQLSMSQSQHAAPREPIRAKISYNPIDVASAKFIAKELFETYDENRSGAIESNEAKSMIIDAYTNINKLFIPKEHEVQSFLDLHDTDRDGRLSLPDLEQICMKFLCNTNYTGGVSLIEEPKILVSDSREVKQSFHALPPRLDQSRILHREYKSSLPSRVPVTGAALKPAPQHVLAGTGGGSGVKDQLKRDLVTNYGIEADRIESELKHARSIFEKYDVNRDGVLDAEEIRRIMQDTYELLGMKFNPTAADVQKYIEMMDKNSDGNISINEYEIFVLKALKKRQLDI